MMGTTKLSVDSKHDACVALSNVDMSHDCRNECDLSFGCKVRLQAVTEACRWQPVGLEQVF